ncbi:glycosyltransferase family 4 protein [uncultured Dokdonia sp.]|uniref:glycosyltransferase family 4 protein n=1 Tax=uncultured Dokdonia sp. TaxID=575653 RepID=UPI00262E0DDD|nr:glycosyltransferase family 4 protein [uncultured Dokdonia sp.]
MRVLQLIDSLDLGGAERIAVEYANMLSQHITQSHLCASRFEGKLVSTIHSDVNYFFLNRKRTLDFDAIKRLDAYIKKEKITIVHAHSTSYFIATLLKFRNPSIVLIWHNHSGASIHLKGMKMRVLRFCSTYFNTIISVNEDLVTWAHKKLKSQKVIYLPNFVNFSKDIKPLQETLKGVSGKRLVCLANLRDPKGHHFLIQSFVTVQKEIPEATLHLIGKDFDDTYSNTLKALIKQHQLQDNVFIYGQSSTPESILEQCDIGVLSSSSEGLPMALLEYGRAKLSVVVTDVGYCSEVVKEYGKFVPYGDEEKMANAIKNYLKDTEKQQIDSHLFKEYVKDNFSAQHVRNQIIKVYKSSFENI